MIFRVQGSWKYQTKVQEEAGDVNLGSDSNGPSRVRGIIKDVMQLSLELTLQWLSLNIVNLSSCLACLKYPIQKECNDTDGCACGQVFLSIRVG